MATYAIGDVQGCLASLTALLEKINFDRNNDRLWLTGDLVNRGPDSVGVLRYVRALGDSAVSVLGNHDLHLLAAAADPTRLKRRDTLDDVLAADDSEELLQWLRWRPLLHRDSALGYTMVHAGLAPQWSVPEAMGYAHEVEKMLRSDRHEEFYTHMYGNAPNRWRADLVGWERLRFVTNVFTRIRYCDDSGALDLDQKGAPSAKDKSISPWFAINHRASTDETILFGHWSTLGFVKSNNIICLDSGCLWGGHLTAIRLDLPHAPTFRVNCERQRTTAAGG